MRVEFLNLINRFCDYSLIEKIIITYDDYINFICHCPTFSIAFAFIRRAIMLVVPSPFVLFWRSFCETLTTILNGKNLSSQRLCCIKTNTNCIFPIFVWAIFRISLTDYFFGAFESSNGIFILPASKYINWDSFGNWNYSLLQKYYTLIRI